MVGTDHRNEGGVGGEDKCRGASTSTGTLWRGRHGWWTSSPSKRHDGGGGRLKSQHVRKTNARRLSWVGLDFWQLAHLEAKGGGAFNKASRRSCSFEERGTWEGKAGLLRLTSGMEWAPVRPACSVIDDKLRVPQSKIQAFGGRRAGSTLKRVAGELENC